MDVLRGALTNLGKYNEGGLDYVWVSFPCDEDDFQDSLEKIESGKIVETVLFMKNGFSLIGTRTMPGWIWTGLVNT